MSDLRSFRRSASKVLDQTDGQSYLDHNSFVKNNIEIRIVRVRKITEHQRKQFNLLKTANLS